MVTMISIWLQPIYVHEARRLPQHDAAFEHRTGFDACAPSCTLFCRKIDADRGNERRQPGRAAQGGKTVR